MEHFSIDPHAALPTVAHAETGNPLPFYLGPTIEGPPAKERGPVSWLPGGSRLFPLSQLTAHWKVVVQNE